MIGIFEEMDSFYWPKKHLWKGDKKIGHGPPPPHLDKIQKNSNFFRETIPTPFKIIHSCVGMMEQTAISNQTEGSGWWQKKYYEGWAAFQNTLKLPLCLLLHLNPTSHQPCQFANSPIEKKNFFWNSVLNRGSHPPTPCIEDANCLFLGHQFL